MARSNSNHFVIQKGVLQRSTLEENIKWCVRALASMQKGELTGHTDVSSAGADLMELMFRRDSPKLREEVKNRISATLSEWEPRIELEETEITPDQIDPELLAVKIKYKIKDTRRMEMVRVLL